METTARTVDEAKELALDQLGVAEDDAELVVLDEPKAGLFGRVRGEARVRARVRPTQARQKVERRDRKKKKGDEPETNGDAAESGVPSTAVTADAGGQPPQAGAPSNGPGPRPRSRAEQDGPRRSDRDMPAASDSKDRTIVSPAAVGEQARLFVDDLVLAFGLQGTTTLVEDGDDLEVQVEGDDLGLLVGPRGTTLQAVQDLARVASQRRLGDHDTRLRVDVGGYRVRRREALGRFALQVAGEVRSTSTARALEPMSSADRKIIHEALADHEGVTTRSEGDDPTRRVIIDPSVD
ncbi:MAG: RNA-binding cell elongation regulator Jag/EloR [Ilumatobacteraceae bacterium]